MGGLFSSPDPAPLAAPTFPLPEIPYAVRISVIRINVYPPYTGGVNAQDARNTLLFWGTLLPGFDAQTDWVAYASLSFCDVYAFVDTTGNIVEAVVKNTDDVLNFITLMQSNGFSCERLFDHRYVFRRGLWAKTKTTYQFELSVQRLVERVTAKKEGRIIE